MICYGIYSIVLHKHKSFIQQQYNLIKKVNH